MRNTSSENPDPDETSPGAPDWESFETYEGPEDDTIRNPVLSAMIHWVSVVVMLAVTFTVCGVLLVALTARALRHQLDEIPGLGWIIFLAGGVLGAGGLIRIYFRKEGR